MREDAGERSYARELVFSIKENLIQSVIIIISLNND